MIENQNVRQEFDEYNKKKCILEDEINEIKLKEVEIEQKYENFMELRSQIESVFSDVFQNDGNKELDEFQIIYDNLNLEYSAIEQKYEEDKERIYSEKEYLYDLEEQYKQEINKKYEEISEEETELNGI